MTQDTAIVRLEQIGPFPFNEVQTQVEKYRNAEVYWVQEEPANHAFWGYVKDRLAIVTKRLGRPDPKHLSRRVAAASAPGSTATHKREQEELLSSIFR